MKITLKNGKTIRLNWSSLIFEKLEEYKGGLDKLKEDSENPNMKIKVINYMVYAIVSSNYPEELTLNQAVSLVEPLDIVKIMDFVDENLDKMNVN